MQSPVDERDDRSRQPLAESSRPQYQSYGAMFAEDDDVTPVEVTWSYMSKLYLLVPVVTLFFFGGLVLIVTFAWPPSKQERREGQAYPHPFLPWPFLVGIFAACTVQTLRVPVWTIVSWLNISARSVTLISTALHSTLHELLRLSTCPIIKPSPTSGFHSTYYLGLGWGIAEATWGIIQGWEQMSLYEDIMQPTPIDSSPESRNLLEQDGEDDADEEEELERKVEALERMRGRRDLEEVIGIPFPNIPFPLHLLWRLDTLLLNLGLTLILSAFYFDPAPIYHHKSPMTVPGHSVNPYMWLVWFLAAVLHTSVSLVWKVVGRVGVGAVTWGALIVSLGTVFAGLGAWGGVV